MDPTYLRRTNLWTLTPTGGCYHTRSSPKSRKSLGVEGFSKTVWQQDGAKIPLDQHCDGLA